jgi:hypothetical protein
LLVTSRKALGRKIRVAVGGASDSELDPGSAPEVVSVAAADSSSVCEDKMGSEGDFLDWDRVVLGIVEMRAT